MTSELLVRGSELVLKGKNRPAFESQLLRNMRRSLDGIASFKFRKVRASYILEFAEPPTERVLWHLQKVFGVAYCAPLHRAELDLDDLITSLLRQLPTRAGIRFAVRCRRLNRNFPYSSMELNEVLGRAIQESRDWPVQLDQPELELHVDVMDESIYFHWQRYPGLRGLPVGVSGKVVVLLSGGIDSPVAAYQLASRGCLPIYVHCHSAPYTSRASIEKAKEIVEQLESYHYPSRLYLIPLARIQEAIVTSCPEPLRVILYRRFMVRLAERIAWREKAHALVTGESVGQVASQTLPNLRVVDAVAERPIMRPLIGLNKETIIEQARQIGSYELSIQPDQDCCSYLMPRKPVIHAKLGEVETAESELVIETLLQEALVATELWKRGETTYPFRFKDKTDKKVSDGG